MFGIVFYSKNTASREACERLIEWLKNRNISFALEKNSLVSLENVVYLDIQTLAKNYRYLVVIGGDGSILRASRYCALYSTILVGINQGTTGFLSQLEPANMIEGMERILKNEFQLCKRLMLQATVFRKGKKINSFYGLNDAVLKVGSLSRIVNFRLYANGFFVEEYPGDGVLVSTPTGSTGYSLSNGGPIVKPEFDLLLLSPICTHKFNARPMIFSKNDELRITMVQPNSYVSSKVALTVDGQVGFNLCEGDEVKIQAAHKKIQIAQVFERDFFELIRTKIG